jgi:hypothetical protein
VLNISGTKVFDVETLKLLLTKIPDLRHIELDRHQWRDAPAANRQRQDPAERRCTADLLRAELLVGPDVAKEGQAMEA